MRRPAPPRAPVSRSALGLSLREREVIFQGLTNGPIPGRHPRQERS
ncbi:MAG: hypothetical protein ACREQ5_29910 [Candidatus Dormibacteria bacterium]